MSALTEALREEFQDREYREGYDEAFLDHRIATQIRVIREQRPMTQKQLADAAGMKQSRVSELEDEDYGSWSVNTLRRIAYALGVRLRIEFAEWGTLLHDVESSGRIDLERRPFEDDPVFAPERTETSAATSNMGTLEGFPAVNMRAAVSLMKEKYAHKPSLLRKKGYLGFRGNQSLMTVGSTGHV